MENEKPASLFAKGFAMGMADIVPGVSGGTIALITGIYDRLVGSLSRVNHKVRDIDYKFFVPVGQGALLAIFLMSSVIDYALDELASPTFAFFFALILASSLLLYKDIRNIQVMHIGATAIGFAFVFFIVGFRDTELVSSHSLPVVFIAGLIAICAMILPGISGALILLILGQYKYLLGSLKALDIGVILTFGAGAIIGLLAFSRGLNKILKKHRDIALAFLIGLMLGALRIPLEEIELSSGSIFPTIIALAAGFAVIWLFYRAQVKARRRKMRKRKPRKTLRTD